jgi:uncharacterized membrane protein YeiH
LDIIGILAVALVSGLGGGMIRDILLARVPLSLRDAWYLVAVAGAALIGGCSRRRRTGCTSRCW